MTISACIIAKGPSDDLTRCLRSLRGKVDQTVVACEPEHVAAMRGCLRARDVVVPFAWCDDFSAARNAAFARATGDWLFWIDADEAVDGDLRRLCELVPDGIDGVWVTCMSFADEEGNIGASARQWRLGRSRIGVHFEGRVHEQPALAERVPVLATQEGVTIFHWGYLPERMARKRFRSLTILRQEVEARPDDPRAHFGLAMEFSAAEEYAQAMQPFREAIRLWREAALAGAPPIVWAPALFTSAIFAAVKAGELALAITIAGEAPKEAFTPDYFYFTAMASWDSGFKEDALGLLERGLQATPDPHFHEASIPGRIREALAALRG